MSEPQIRSWADVERALAGRPRSAMVDLAVRAAVRQLPAVSALEAAYGAEAREWVEACEGVARLVEAYVRGELSSRFRLAVAAATVRTAAEATAAAARERGHSALIEPAELAYAALAFAADAARSPTESRAAMLAMQALRAAAGGEDVPVELTKALRP